MMQLDRATPSSAAGRVRPILATLFGIPVAVIVLAAADGRAAPLVGDGAAALVAVLLLGSAMCSLGMAAMGERFGVGRASIVGAPLGVLALAFVLSGLFGRPLLLDPIVDALGGPDDASLTQAAIVGVGMVMLGKWAIAWTSYLPRGASR
jgi:hypothetical protein